MKHLLAIFAIIFNLNILTTTQVSKDETIKDTYQANNELINFPTVVADIKTSDTLNSLLSTPTRPSNAILHVNNSLNVIDENSNSLGSLNDVIKKKLQNYIIPIVYLENNVQASKYIEFLNENLIIDMAIMSNDVSLIKMVKDVHYVIRGIYYINEILENTPLCDLVYTANKNYASVIALNSKIATRENISYLQARFKTVWINQTDETDFNLYSSINTGCYGLIVNDYENLYNLYLSYNKNTLIRTPFNVAHRGFSILYNENSVYGTQKAIELGATHVELDAYLTTDNEIVMMHDNSIDRTSDGTGNVESYTLEQLQKFSLDLKSPSEPIPSIEDVAKPLIKSDAVLVLELKSNNAKIVEVLKEKITKLNLYSKIVVISFYTDVLKAMKELIPEIPTANLNDISTSNFTLVLYWMGLYNTVIDTQFNLINKNENELYLRDRGIMGWYWTYDNALYIGSNISKGPVGMTNNSCSFFSNLIQYIDGQEFTLKKHQNIKKASFNLLYTTYNGQQKEIEGKLFKYEDKGDYYNVICSLETKFSEYCKATFYTGSFKVYKHPSDLNNGCIKSSTNILITLSLISFLSFTILKKKNFIK